jgi:hypothetical protein
VNQACEPPLTRCILGTNGGNLLCAWVTLGSVTTGPDLSLSIYKTEEGFS